MIEVAQTIPPSLKLTPVSNGRLVEKWILGAAFENLLPAAIIWRDKAQFDQGTAATELLSALARAHELYVDGSAASRSRPSIAWLHR